MMQISMPKQLIHSYIIHSLSQLTQEPYPVVTWNSEMEMNTLIYITHQLLI